MIGIITTVLNTIIAAYVWYFVGRHSAYSELLASYKEMAEHVGRQGTLLDEYKIEFEKMRDNGSKKEEEA